MRHLTSRARILALASGVVLCGLAVGLWLRGGAAISVRAAPNSPLTPQTQTRVGFAAGNDWEPAIAADRFAHVYVLFKHYDVAGQVTCSACNLHVLLQVSSDRGQTWSAPRPIDPEPVVSGQYDSQIMVDPVDGKTVWASFLQNGKSSVAVMRSTDFGQNWSGPTLVDSLQRSADKDILAVRGLTIAVAYNAAQKIYAAVSHDGGATWVNALINNGSTQLGWSLAGGGAIDSQGTIYFAFVGFTQNGGAKGPVNLFISASRDGGATWTQSPLGVSGAPYPCDNCGFAFLGAQITLAVGSDDSVYALWNATVDQTDYAPERIYFARSTNHGATYSPRQDVSLAAIGVEHSFPAIVTGARAGDVRIGWMDARNAGRWNLVSRTSTNGGASWTGETQISSYVPGYDYLTSTGFGLPYGDYFEMDVDSTGATQFAWGESNCYSTCPGNIWTSHT